jgi:hypothetical protein
VMTALSNFRASAIKKSFISTRIPCDFIGAEGRYANHNEIGPLLRQILGKQGAGDSKI